MQKQTRCLCRCGMLVRPGRDFAAGSHASVAVWREVKRKHKSAAGLLKAMRRRGK